MPEIGTSGSMSEDEKRSDAAWPQRPRSSSTLPLASFPRVSSPSLAAPVYFDHTETVVAMVVAIL